MGKVFIVGAGTGRLENITYKAKRLIEQADIIFYDRLINQNLLLMAKPDCQLVDVGKIVGGAGTTQAEIHQLIKEASHNYRTVLRLKSGDPYVFGRGGEEALELIEAGIDYEVVPGITTSIGGLTYAGIPVTFRNVALDYHVFTGHAMNGIAEYDWGSVAKLNGTLVFLMGVKALPTIVSSLIKQGKAVETPVAVIEWASRACQRKVVGALDNIESLVKQAGLKPPCLIVVGQVVAFQNQLDFFEKKSLFGKRIVLPQSVSGKMFDQLEDLGAEVVLMQSVNTELKTINTIEEFEQQSLVFLDVPSVQTFMKWMSQEKLNWRQLGSHKIYAVTDHVKDYLTKIGVGFNEIWIDFKRFNEAVQTCLINERMTILGSQAHLNQISDVGSFSQIITTSIEKYPEILNLDELVGADYFVFPNSKAVRSIRNYLKELEEPEVLLNKPAFCMGEITSNQLKLAGFNNIVTSPQANAQSLYRTISQYKEGE